MTTPEIQNQPTADTAADATAITIEAAAAATQVIDLAKASPSLDLHDYLKNSLPTASGIESILQGLAGEREAWERTELAASRSRLYAILTKCYEFYLVLKSSDTAKGVRKQLADGLELFIKSRGLRTLSKTHDMNRVVKAVFGEDRRRVSAYAMALRAALVAGAEVGAKSEHVPADQLASWIEAKGGVEEVRLGSKNSGLTVKERADLAADAVDSEKPLMTFKPDAKTMPFSADDADKKFVLVVTYRPTGELEVNTVVQHDSAVRAALAIYYSENKDRISDLPNAKASAKSTAVAAALGN
jgi:hypothetical protein